MNRLKVILNFIALLSLSLPLASLAKNCQPIDLRDGSTIPVRSQLYVHDGMVKDSRFCYAFTLANLVGKQLGAAVSAAEIGVQYAFSWPKSSTPLFPLNFGFGGYIKDTFEVMGKIGYCKNSEFAKYLSAVSLNQKDWYLALNIKNEKLNFQEFQEEVGHACEGRVNLPQDLTFFYYQNDESSREGNSTNFNTETSQKMMADINDQLDNGKVIALSYDSHYVSIVGRTKNCDYIIQDSIPHFYRVSEGLRNPYYETQGEHIQFWTERSLKNTLHWGSSQLGSIPGIGYLK